MNTKETIRTSYTAEWRILKWKVQSQLGDQSLAGAIRTARSLCASRMNFRIIKRVTIARETRCVVYKGH